MIKMKKGFNIIYSLAVTSMLGFSAIVTQAFFNFDIDPWVNGLLFVVIGIGLTLIGSIWTAVRWKDGLDNQEIGNIMLTTVGALSIIVGIIELPIGLWASINIPGFEGVKATVALFAIVLIALQTFLVKR